MNNSEVDWQAVVNLIEATVEDMANVNAAMAWSTPSDEILDRYGDDVWVLACFGDRCAINGNPVDPGRKIEPPQGYVLTRYGGDIPTTEEEIDMEHVVQYVARKLNLPEKVVWKIADDEGYDRLHYVSVSGYSEVWKKGKTR